MPNVSAVIFAAQHLVRASVKGARVLDVGSRNFNGSIREFVEALEPAEYLGVDLEAGAGVDQVVAAENLPTSFGPDAFDIVISLEMLEHAQDWKRAVNGIKGVCKPGGVLILSTRSIGFPVHGYPHDFWRFGTEDLKSIFADFQIESIAQDQHEPGAFIFARKPLKYVPLALDELAMHCIFTGKKERDFSPACYSDSYARRLYLKQYLRDALHSSIRILGRLIKRLLRL